MRSDSIDIGNFAARMTGWPNQPASYGFYDLPGCYHNLACGFSFADGHSEIHRWRDGRTMPPLVDKRQCQRPVCFSEQPRCRLAAGPRDAPKVGQASRLPAPRESPQEAPISLGVGN